MSNNKQLARDEDFAKQNISASAKMLEKKIRKLIFANINFVNFQTVDQRVAQTRRLRRLAASAFISCSCFCCFCCCSVSVFVAVGCRAVVRIVDAYFYEHV